jgi:hypothetical protein
MMIVDVDADAEDLWMWMQRKLPLLPLRKLPQLAPCTGTLVWLRAAKPSRPADPQTLY